MVPTSAGTAVHPPSWQTPATQGVMTFGEQASPSSPATQDPVAGSHFCGQLPRVRPQDFGTPTQTPAPLQALLTWHRLPSSQGVPAGCGTAAPQVPDTGSQEDCTQQPKGSSLVGHVSGVPTQFPCESQASSL